MLWRFLNMWKYLFPFNDFFEQMLWEVGSSDCQLSVIPKWYTPFVIVWLCLNSCINMAGMLSKLQGKVKWQWFAANYNEATKWLQKDLLLALNSYRHSISANLLSKAGIFLIFRMLFPTLIFSIFWVGGNFIF